MENLVRLGALIRQRREAIHLTREDVVKGRGFTESYLAYIEEGKRRPSRAVCEALSAALSLSVDELLRLAGHVPPGTPMHLDPEEQDLIDLWRRTEPTLRKAALAMLRSAEGMPEP